MMIKRFLEWVDTEPLRLPQAIIYFWYFIAGIYMTFISSVPAVLFNTTGPWYNDVWSASFIFCPLVILIGYHLKNQYSGTLIQVGANFCVSISLAAYVASLVNADLLDKGTFAFFATVALIMVSALITFRDGRKFMLIRAVAQQLSSGDRTEHGVG